MERRKSRLDMLIIFIIGMLPRLVTIFLLAYPLRTTIDEMSTIATGAYLAGYDWSLMAEAGQHYYGGGYTALMAPLFHLIEDPILLYRVFLVVSAVLQSLTGVMAYHVLKRYMKVDSRLLCVLAGIGISYTQIIRTMMVYNEHMLAFMIWIIVILVCRLAGNTENKTRRSLDTVFLMLSLSYCLTLHTRSKVFWIAVVMLVVFYRIFCKRILVSIIPAVVTGVVGYYLAGEFIDWSKTAVWLWEEGEYLTNASVKLELSIDMLKNPIAWSGWFQTVMGQVHISTIFTGGLTAILIPVLVVYLWRSGKKMLGFSTLPMETTETESTARPYMFLTALFAGMVIGAMIFAQSFTWLHRVISALENSPYGKNPYGYKAYTYIRYYAIALGPFIVGGIAVLYHCRSLVREHIKSILTVFGVLQAVFVFVILQHITNSTVTTSVYVPFSWAKEGQGGVKLYLAGVIICCILFMAFLILYLKKKFVVPMLIFSLLMPYQYLYNAVVTDGDRISENYGRVDKGTELLAKIKDSEDFPEQIYLYDMGKYAYVCQFMLKDVKMDTGLPADLAEDNIVYSSEKNAEKLLTEGYLCGKLDRKEYIYVKGEKYIALLEEQGLELSGAATE